MKKKKKKKKKKMMNKTLYHSPYIYDARHHANPYILSTTVLSDNVASLRLTEGSHKFHTQENLGHCKMGDEDSEVKTRQYVDSILYTLIDYHL